MAPAVVQQGPTRREVLRRGAIIGAAVWTVPALQSALAPAAAASPPPVCTVNCPPGSACATNTNCSTGLCLNGICVIPYPGGGTCTANSQCQSGNCLGGTCAAAWPGTTCTSSSQCLSGKCAGGT
ncbi:MAG TPA: hypothetical protein VMW94_04310, partial [Actinomycetes bacterium]|nr:hypothetical protein [Actinomycetes bacterium]